MLSNNNPGTSEESQLWAPAVILSEQGRSKLSAAQVMTANQNTEVREEKGGKYRRGDRTVLSVQHDYY